MSEKRVTIGDISSALGISTSTVSRALSGRGYVAAEVKTRIHEAARRMGYVPDLTARNLRQRSSSTIGLVVTTLLDPFYARLAAGFQEVARTQGYEVVLILDQADPKEELAAVESLIAMGVSGVAITPVTARAVNRIKEYGLPLLQIDRSVSADHSLVAGDNRAGARMATQYLLEKNHQRIAFVIDHVNWTSGSDRLAGWREAYETAGRDAPEELFFTLGDSHSQIVEGIPAALKRMRAAGVTAIFAANSVVAQELYLKLLEAGIRVPEDTSLVAYDDLHWTLMVRPAVTVVSQHVDELGRHAADTLLRAVGQGAGGGIPLRIYIRPTLVERGSVLPISSE